MIIVSQDKTVTINSDYIESIEIGNIEENQSKGVIYARLKSDYFYKIAEYKTEERAKEVLEQILIKYRECNNFGIDGTGFVANKVFYMPEG